MRTSTPQRQSAANTSRLILYSVLSAASLRDRRGGAAAGMAASPSSRR